MSGTGTGDSFSQRVAARAGEIRILRILLTVLAAPFYVIGFVVGFVWLAVRWTISALIIGFSDAMNRNGRPDDDDAG